MSLWLLLLVVCFAGSLGGVVNALMSDNGFILPKPVAVENGVSIIRPGFVGNMIIGAIAAGISWSLYGPLAAYAIIGSTEALAKNTTSAVALSLSALAGGVLVGVGGSRWLSNEVDKSLLKAAAVKAAEGNASEPSSKKLALASPAGALAIAKAMSP